MTPPTVTQTWLLMRLALLLLAAILVLRWTAWGVFAYLNGIITIGGDHVFSLIAALFIPVVTLIFEFLLVLGDFRDSL